MTFEIVVFFLLASLFLYALLGGADFGAGILEFVSPGGKDKRFRELASKAIAPVWEANHIWLIIALVILFYAFPDAHVLLATRLHLPMILMLVGILLRGSAFTYRYYDVQQDPKTFKLFSALYHVGSLMVPLFFGIMLATMAGGTMAPESASITVADYFVSWIRPFPFFTGFFVISVFAFLAAAFLQGETKDPDLLSLLDKMLMQAVLAMLICGFLALISAFFYAPLFMNMVFKGWVGPASFIVGSALLPVYFYLKKSRRTWLTRAWASILLFMILMGFLGVMFPNFIVFADGSVLTLRSSAAPQVVFDTLAVALLAGSMVMFPALYWLLYVFKIKQPEP